MDPALDKEFVSIDPLVEEGVHSGKITQEDAGLLEEQLVSVGMTGTEAKEDLDGFAEGLSERDRLKQRDMETWSIWKRYASGITPGYYSSIVAGMVRSYNGVQELADELSARGKSVPLSALALSNLQERFEAEGGEWNLGQAAKIIRAAGETFETGADVVLEHTPKSEDATLPEVREGWDYALVEGASQFISGQAVINSLIPGAGAAKWGVRAWREAREGAMVAGIFFKSEQGTLADFVADFIDLDRDPDSGESPVAYHLRNYLGSEQEDDFLTGRLKLALADMPLGLALPAVMRVFKGLRDKVVWGANKRMETLKETTSTNIGDVAPPSGPGVEPIPVNTVEEQLQLSGYDPVTAKRFADEAAETAAGFKEAISIVDPDAFDNFLWGTKQEPKQVYSVEGSELGGRTAQKSADEVRRRGGTNGINWNYKMFESQADVEQVTNEMVSALEESWKRTGIDPESLETSMRIAETLNLNPEQLEGIAGTLQRTRYQMIAAHILQGQGVVRMAELADVVRNAVPGDAQAIAEAHLHMHFNMLGQMHNWISAAETEMGRLLQSQQTPIPGLTPNADINKWKAYIDSYGSRPKTTKSLLQLTKQIEIQREMGAPGVWLEQLKVASRKLARGAALTRDFVVDVAIQGMIGNGITLSRNILGNTYALADNLIITQFKGLTPGSGVPIEEAFVKLRALVRFFPDSFQRSTISLITDNPNTHFFRKEFYKKSRTGPLGGLLVDSDLFISDGLSLLNKSIYLPGRINMSLDEFYQSINIGMQREAMAYRIAKQMETEGFSRNDVFNDILTRNPNAPLEVKSQYKSLDQEEAAFAAKQTYAEIAGKRPSHFNRVHDAIHWLKNNDISGFSKLMFPFYNTTVNLDKFALERIPGANFLIKETADDILGKRGRELQAEALGKLFIGSGILSTGFWLAESGDMTAGYPPEPSPYKETELDTPRIPKRRYLMDSDWQPYSMLSEDGYTSTAGLDPVSMLIQGGADMNMLYHIYQSEEVQKGLFATDEEFESAVDASSEFFFYLANAAKTKIDIRPLAKGLSDIVSLADLDPDAHGFKTAAANLLSTVNPVSAYYQSLRSQWAQADDRYQRNAKATEIMQKVHMNWRRKNIALFDPTGMGGSKTLNPRVNFMGDPILRQVPIHLKGVDISRALAFFNPLRTTPKDLNPVTIRIHKLGGLTSDYPVRWTTIDRPKAAGKGETTPHLLTEEQQYDWVKAATALNRKVLPGIIKSFTNKDGKELLSPNKQREKLEYWIAYNKSKAQIIVQAKADSWKEIRDQWPKWEAERGQSEAEGGQTEELYNTTGERTQPVKEESPSQELPNVTNFPSGMPRPAQLQQYIESQ